MSHLEWIIRKRGEKKNVDDVDEKKDESSNKDSTRDAVENWQGN